MSSYPSGSLYFNRGTRQMAGLYGLLQVPASTADEQLFDSHVIDQPERGLSRASLIIDTSRGVNPNPQLLPAANRCHLSVDELAVLPLWGWTATNPGACQIYLRHTRIPSSDPDQRWCIAVGAIRDASRLGWPDNAFIDLKDGQSISVRPYPQGRNRRPSQVLERPFMLVDGGRVALQATQGLAAVEALEFIRTLGQGPHDEATRERMDRVAGMWPTYRDAIDDIDAARRREVIQHLMPDRPPLWVPLTAEQQMRLEQATLAADSPHPTTRGVSEGSPVL